MCSSQICLQSLQSHRHPTYHRLPADIEILEISQGMMAVSHTPGSASERFGQNFCFIFINSLFYILIINKKLVKKTKKKHSPWQNIVGMFGKILFLF